MKKKVLSFMMYFCLMAGIMSGCGHEHSWVDATCTEPKTCIECGEAEGDALGHTWVDATCTEPKTCSVCGETEGSALGHAWIDATCTEPKTCSVCGETEGTAPGHTWTDATCINPKTCSICGETEGDIGDHSWVQATCLTPQTCNICGETVGELAPHNYNENGICVVCRQSREVELTLDNVNDYLTLSYEITNIEDEDRYQHGMQTYGTITFIVTPKTDEYIFQDVIVGVSSYRSRPDQTLDEFLEFGASWPYNPSVLLDSTGNGSKDYRTSIMDSKGRPLEAAYILSVSGICIRK